MDIQKALNELYEEKKRLDWTISTLEARLKKVSSVSRSRRGRKSMGGEERLEVSKRMSAYWAGRRAAKRGAQAAGVENLDQQPTMDAVDQNFPMLEQQGLGPESVGPPSIGPQSAQSAHLDDSRLSA
ncbi:MAG TPA: hypothetical protein VKG25_06610 [Bryobacteraceae bacterium]|nr:hypothetical protein [Bryobacteraceae bacterium]